MVVLITHSSYPEKERGGMEAKGTFLLIGEMAEWTKAAASKAVIPHILGIGGSNPSLSTIKTVGI